MTKSELRKVRKAAHAMGLSLGAGDFETRCEIIEAVDGGYMLLISGVQYGGTRDLSGAGDMVYATIEEALQAYVDARDQPVKPKRTRKVSHVATREEQHGRYLDCGPGAWDDRD